MRRLSVLDTMRGTEEVLNIFNTDTKEHSWLISILRVS